jgi:hypothetical protein
MQHSVADQLQKEAMLALKIAAPGSTHEVHRIGVGAKQSELLASPMEGTDKVQTLTLTGGSGQSKRNHVFRTRVTSLDWWESEHSFNRSILYIKVDTNGHEPAVLRPDSKRVPASAQDSVCAWCVAVRRCGIVCAWCVAVRRCGIVGPVRVLFLIIHRGEPLVPRYLG